MCYAGKAVEGGGLEGAVDEERVMVYIICQVCVLQKVGGWGGGRFTAYERERNDADSLEDPIVNPHHLLPNLPSTLRGYRPPLRDHSEENDQHADECQRTRFR